MHVESFLLARHPLTVAQVQYWLLEYEDDLAEATTGTARLEGDLDGLLELLPLNLPSEAQWEYAARAGTTTLTFRGDGKLNEDQLLDDFGNETRTAAGENAFGLAAMGSANELCADVWIPGFDGAPSDARPRPGDGPGTVRGGAADLYPWQGCDESLLLLSANRYEHADFAAVRPAAPCLPAETGGSGSVASRQAGPMVAEQGCGAPPFGLTARTARLVPRQHGSPVRTCRPDTTLRDESGRSRRIPISTGSSIRGLDERRGLRDIL
ncbi:formylglycine-generating enzyme family protein [Micromonospora parva]|uniref:Formylglycine-generating enzyme family protein n=1 Tax=Micromonospora parva TaxID=1464048 RepID=A0ABW6VMY1_9ACTN